MSTTSKTSTKLKINNIKHRLSKERRSKKIRIISESHGMKLRECFEKNARYNFDVQSTIKPNAKSVNILKNINSTTKDLDEIDFLFVITGTNDINRNTNVDKLLYDIVDSLKNVLKPM